MRLCAVIAAAVIAIPIHASQPAATGVDVFGPGVLSSGEVFRGTFAPDGRTFYFFKRTGEGETYRIWLDAGRARSALGWAPSVPLEAGLRETVTWMRRKAPLAERP